MDIKIEPKSEESLIEEEPQSSFRYDVPVKVERSPDAHVYTTKREDADHTFEINVVNNLKCDTEYQHIKFKDEPEYPIKDENSFGECSYSQYMPAYKSPDPEENTVDSCVGIHGPSLLYGSLPQREDWSIEQKFSTKSHTVPATSASRNSLNAHGPFTEDQIQKPLINIQKTTDKFNQIIQTQTKYENHQAPHDRIDILENIVKNEKFTISKKKALLVLKKASFYDRNFVCSLCFEYFPTARILTDHKLFIHQSIIKSFGCDQCNLKFDKPSSLKRHQITHSSDKPFKCTECKFACNRFDNLRNHTLTHSSEKPFKCDECNYKCISSSDLKAHKMIHSGEKPFQCDMCDYACTRMSRLKKHTMLHSGKHLECNVCNFKCTEFSVFRNHKLVHCGETPFKCSVCDYKCKKLSDIKRHQLTHSVYTLYMCDVCEYKCKGSDALKTHKLNCGKSFECNICDYKFTELHELKEHQLIHNVDKPFMCDECDYKCKYSFALKSHKMVHSGEKPFKCNLCGYRCKTLGNLENHHRIHRSEKPFVCDVCDFKCKQSNTLRKHKKIHGGEKPIKCN